MDEQTIYLPPRTTAFRAVCEACQQEQAPSRGYVGSTVDGALRLEDSRGYVLCPRGHQIRVVRANPDPLYR
jgi:hypothetical protein